MRSVLVVSYQGSSTGCVRQAENVFKKVDRKGSENRKIEKKGEKQQRDGKVIETKRQKREGERRKVAEGENEKGDRTEATGKTERRQRTLQIHLACVCGRIQ